MKYKILLVLLIFILILIVSLLLRAYEKIANIHHFTKLSSIRTEDKDNSLTSRIREIVISLCVNNQYGEAYEAIDCLNSYIQLNSKSKFIDWYDPTAIRLWSLVSDSAVDNAPQFLQNDCVTATLFTLKNEKYVYPHPHEISGNVILAIRNKNEFLQTTNGISIVRNYQKMNNKYNEKTFIKYENWCNERSIPNKINERKFVNFNVTCDWLKKIGVCRKLANSLCSSSLSKINYYLNNHALYGFGNNGYFPVINSAYNKDLANNIEKICCNMQELFDDLSEKETLKQIKKQIKRDCFGFRNMQKYFGGIPSHDFQKKALSNFEKKKNDIVTNYTFPLHVKTFILNLHPSEIASC